MFFLRADLPEADIGPERGGHHHVPPFCGTIDADGNVSHRDCEQGGNDNLYRWAFLYWFVVHRVRVPDDLHGVGVARRAGPGAQAGQVPRRGARRFRRRTRTGSRRSPCPTSSPPPSPGYGASSSTPSIFPTSAAFDSAELIRRTSRRPRRTSGS